jgi:hypothetical protein
MNDRSEFQYGYRLLHASLLRAAKSASSDGLRTALLLAAHDNWFDEFDLYLTCFCEGEDLLSQWRGYGGQVSRYCLKFETLNLRPRPGGSHPIAVVYDEDLQNEVIDNIVAVHVSVLTKLDADSLYRLTYDAIRSIYSYMMPILVCFKSSAFAEEREWRYVDLVIRDNTIGPIDFTNSEGMMKPYQILLSGSTATEKLPLREVLAGAARSGTEALQSAQLMLRRFGYGEVPVRPSRIPLRV